MTHLKSTFLLLMIFCTGTVNSQNLNRSSLFVGYETLEMTMNNFQNFAGEIGYRFNSKHQIRLMIGEVNLTERHLSSSWEAAAVEGENITGYLRIYELYYDRFFGKRKNFYFSGSLGYVNDKYDHLISDNSLENETATVGFAIGYKKENLFGFENIYTNISIPFRYYFNEIPETRWGDSKILEHKFVNNIWLFIGFKF